MAYYNGTVANLTGLLTALTNACVADGWTYSVEELVKHGCYFKISVDAYSGAYERLRMQIKSPTTSNSSRVVCIKNMGNVVISFPAEYHIFTFDKEVYCVLNIQPGKYAWLAFGASTISVTGSGAFLSGSCSNSTSTSIEYNVPIFFGSSSRNISASHANLFHSGFSYPLEFDPGPSTNTLPMESSDYYSSTNGVGYSQPNNFSGESILTPLQIWCEYSASKYCLTFVSEHARRVRIDNYEDEQIITYGSDKWMVFPWLRRDSADRNIASDYYTIADAGSGTWGWAIRYEGP